MHSREDFTRILLDLGVLIVLLQVLISIMRLVENHALQEMVMSDNSLLNTPLDNSLVSLNCLISHLSLDVLEVEKCHLRGLLPHLGPSSELLLKLVLGGDWIFQHGGDGKYFGVGDGLGDEACFFVESILKVIYFSVCCIDGVLIGNSFSKHEWRCWIRMCLPLSKSHILFTSSNAFILVLHAV